MFTGIIEETGQTVFLKKAAVSALIRIRADLITQDLRTGDSVAVNGVCLTVTDTKRGFFDADVMHETLQKSALGNLRDGMPVNLERAMPMNGRFGGHIVTGHTDGTGHITGIRQDENAVWYQISTSPDILRRIACKGSITVDGVSLTVAGLTDLFFTVSVIPHTRAQTIFRTYETGTEVNLENDLIARYIEKCMTVRTPSAPAQESRISRAYLERNGF